MSGMIVCKSTCDADDDDGGDIDSALCRKRSE